MATDPQAEAFDAWLWGLEDGALERLRLPDLARVAREDGGLELPQLTFLTVLAPGDEAVEPLTTAARGTAGAIRQTRTGGLIKSRMRQSELLLSVWPSGEPGVHHLVASAPVTDSRWRRVEHSWLPRAAPALTPIILNKSDFESIGDALSEHGDVAVNRLTARVVEDHSSYFRGWHGSEGRRQPTHRQALAETRDMLVRTMSLRVGDRLSVHLRRQAGATYYRGDYDLFVSVVLHRLTAAAGQRRTLLNDRGRQPFEQLEERLVMTVPPAALDEQLDREELLTAVGGLRHAQIAVFHRNPYLHFGVTDYLDGSNFDVVVDENDRLSILPGFRASLGSLARITDVIGDFTGMIQLTDEAISTEIPDSAFIGGGA